MFRSLVPIFAAILMLCRPASAREPSTAQTIRELEDGIQNKPPATYFALATELFRNNRREEAAFWYFVGDIRYRASVLAKAKDADGSEEQYHFWFISQSVGQAILKIADRHPDVLIRAIDRALEWDAEQPNGYTSKIQFQGQYERARQELLALQERIREGKNPPASRPSSVN